MKNSPSKRDLWQDWSQPRNEAKQQHTLARKQFEFQFRMKLIETIVSPQLTNEFCLRKTSLSPLHP